MAKPATSSSPAPAPQSTDSQAAALAGAATAFAPAADAERKVIIQELRDAAHESDADAAGLRIRGHHGEADDQCDHARAFRMAAQFLEESANS